MEWNGGVEYWTGPLECHAHKVIIKYTQYSWVPEASSSNDSMASSLEKQLKTQIITGLGARLWNLD